MKTLAMVLAAGALALTSPATALTGGTNTIETPMAKKAAAFYADQARGDLLQKFGKSKIKPNDYVWDAKGATGELRIVVGLDEQMAYAYKGSTLIGAASVSTAREGKLTPQGEFPVWLKKRMHHSRKYDNAPMPYMQMIDSYGIALHAGHNPGYPASAGCVRLPKGFAAKIFAMSDIGMKVYIGA